MTSLTTRQAEIAAYVARGLPDKVIAHETGLSVSTVRHHVQAAASRLPGSGWPRYKLTVWALDVSDDVRIEQ